jgi:hypothetical protein
MRAISLMLAAATIVVTQPAAAANRLKAPEILGEWCSYGDDAETRTYSAISNLYLTPNKTEREEQVRECGDRILRFRPDVYHGWEHTCRYLSVKEWEDRSKPYAIKTDRGAPSAVIQAKCTGEGCTWNERITVSWSKGTLYVRVRPTGERCG